ncbi:MAG: GNAT family N-acetyltransferase [Halobacteriaceae archaeon]
MDIRQGNAGDADAIRDVARRSLRASYTDALDPADLDAAVERWYALAELEERLADGGTLFLVAEVDDAVVGFSQSRIVDGDPPVGELDWVHVAPDHRGHGYGEQLLTRTEEALHARGVGRIEALVLAANTAGNRFYEERGFEPAGSRELDIGDQHFTENEYVKAAEGVDVEHGLEIHELPDGREVYVDQDGPEEGSKAPFYPVYLDRARTDRYGLTCDNCGSFDTAMDGMGRIECSQCANTRKPTRWDAAYL